MTPTISTVQITMEHYNALRESHDRLLGDNEVLKLQLAAKSATYGCYTRRATLLEIAELGKNAAENYRKHWLETGDEGSVVVALYMDSFAQELERMAENLDSRR